MKWAMTSLRIAFRTCPLCEAGCVLNGIPVELAPA